MSTRCVASLLLLMAAPSSDSPSKLLYARWQNGISSDPNYSPIAVWLQAPRNAERYRRAGINLYVGLWRGPTEEQLQTHKSVGMSTICAQNHLPAGQPRLTLDSRRQPSCRRPVPKPPSDARVKGD